MSNKILIFTLAISVVANLFFLFSQPSLYIAKDIKWNFDSIEAQGFLEAVNYEAPKDWNTIFYIHFDDNSSFGEPSKFYAREIVISGSSMVNLDLKEYEVVEKTEKRLVATDDIYTFEITNNDVFITDKEGHKSKLSNHSIKLK